MIQELNKHVGTDGIIEIQNRERSACKLISAVSENNSVILNFESIFPVRELNFDEIPVWKIDLSTTSFGKHFTFIVDGYIEMPDENKIKFIENERDLTVTVDFAKNAVRETMMKYIDELIPKS